MAPSNALLIFLSIIGAYAALVIFTRIAGIRSFSKMSGFDFAITVAIGSIFASIVMGKSVSLVQGVVVLAILYACQIGFATMRVKLDWVPKLADNKPRLIMIGKDIQYDHLRKAKMSEGDLMAKLREANVGNLESIQIVVAETTGDVSVIHHQDKELSPEVYKNVLGTERLS
ncbi:DUF421 domain-containing protein [Litorimonas haliclonae]|uniref:DUF421 domain-containing protein n=1 Tax=Litorimonas haliclonae TaxID=2081977 RepID=UPI0039EE7642